MPMVLDAVTPVSATTGVTDTVTSRPAIAENPSRPARPSSAEPGCGRSLPFANTRSPSVRRALPAYVGSRAGAGG